MKPFRTFFILLCLGLFSSLGFAAIPDYHSFTDVLSASPAAYKYGYYGFFNPANLSMLEDGGIRYMWDGRRERSNKDSKSGLFIGLPGMGYGYQTTRFSGQSVTDYRLSWGFGIKAFSLGYSWGWSEGDNSFFDRKSTFTIGSIIRTSDYFSLGYTNTSETKGSDSQTAIDIAYRPLGNELLTLYGDYVYHNDSDDARKSIGFIGEPYSGVRVFTRYFNRENITFGLNISFGYSGITTQSNSKTDVSSYILRVGGYDRNIIRTYMQKSTKYVRLDLDRQIKYQKYKWFDNSITLSLLLDVIDGAIHDDTVAGVVVNLSQMKITNPVMIWELRDKLEDLRRSGKKVIVYFSYATMHGYYLASVADTIVVDPVGVVALKGFAFTKPFFRGALEKLAIGFEEFKYFKYKTAVDSFSRKDMSEGDREQLDRYVGNYYRSYRDDICKARNISAELFDDLVDNKAYIGLSPIRAKEEKLVDHIGRIDDVDEFIKRIAGNNKKVVGPGVIGKYQLPDDDKWGTSPRIALVYALGSTGMDYGIKARQLVKIINDVEEDPLVKSVVIRVDSPGGEILASDIVAQAVKKCRKKKPVVISMGYIAASGGYWISMYGDKIVANKNTLTGSIGVIGGRFYNKGILNNLGVTTSIVKRGKHADIDSGFIIPDREYDAEEKDKVREVILPLYDTFISKVSDARGISKDAVSKVAQGRIWSGSDAITHKLIDELGGLDTAIRIAKRKAGIPDDAEIELLELPKPPLFNWNQMLFGNLGIGVYPRSLVENVRFLLDNNGKSMAMLPLDYWDIDYIESLDEF